MIKAITAITAGLCSLMLGGAELLPEKQWNCLPVEGGKGSMVKLPDGSYEITKANDKGVVFFYCGKNEPAVAPGKTYRVTVDYRTSSDSLAGYIMLSMPGAKRTPFPASKSAPACPDFKTAVLDFTAQQGESKVRIHFCLKGEGKAVVRCYNRENDASSTEGSKAPVSPEEFRMLPGRGVRALAGGKEILAGNPELLSENGILLPPAMRDRAGAFESEGCTVIYLAVDGTAAGLIALSDTVRPDAQHTIDEVKAARAVPVLLTGDHESAARHIAEQLHISEVHANCLPEEKLRWIDTFEKNGRPVCMIGDGINDAPSLKKACVGIAMGGIGSDIAVDAADIALVNDDISELPHLLRLSGKMMRTIRLNLTFSMTLNFIAILLAITGILNPVVGALVHNAGSVLVIINSALLLKWKKS